MGLQSRFRNWIALTAPPYTPEAGRYHLYVSLACPWAHRTLIYRKLLGLEHATSLSVVEPLITTDGCTFGDAPGSVPDSVNRAKFLHEISVKADPHSGRVTMPLLWDRQPRLGRNRYLVGDRITEADWRLFTTLVRFDAVCVGHFKCNRKRIADLPNLSGYPRELYQLTGVRETVNFRTSRSTTTAATRRSIRPASCPWARPSLSTLHTDAGAEGGAGQRDRTHGAASRTRLRVGSPGLRHTGRCSCEPRLSEGGAERHGERLQARHRRKGVRLGLPAASAAGADSEADPCRVRRRGPGR